METAIDPRWRKSSKSGNGGQCVEVAGHGNRVLVRDTSNRAGVMLRFSPRAWRRFAEQVKRSLTDLMPALQGHSRILRCPFGVSGGWFPHGQRSGVRLVLRASAGSPCAFHGHSRSRCGHLFHLPRSFRTAGSRCAFALSSVMGAAGPSCLGRQDWGSGGKPGTGPCFLGPGGFRVSPQCVSGLVLPPGCLLAE
jgi:Domain of unknown function (DUF397)